MNFIFHAVSLKIVSFFDSQIRPLLICQLFLIQLVRMLLSCSQTSIPKNLLTRGEIRIFSLHIREREASWYSLTVSVRPALPMLTNHSIS